MEAFHIIVWIEVFVCSFIVINYSVYTYEMLKPSFNDIVFHVI